MTKLYAFWRYDLFPFVLGGEVVGMDEEGLVKIRSYGGGDRFDPFKLMPLKKGREVHEQLKALEAEHSEALKALEADFLARREAILHVPARQPKK